MDYQELQTHLKQLQGRVLTVIEASYSDPVQRDAVKKLVNVQFSQKLFDIFDQTKAQEKESKHERSKGINP